MIAAPEGAAIGLGRLPGQPPRRWRLPRRWIPCRFASRPAFHPEPTHASGGVSGRRRGLLEKNPAGVDFPLCRGGGGAYMPRQTQYARASGPRPTEPRRSSTTAPNIGSPRRKVYATTSSVLATPFGSPPHGPLGRWFVRPFRQLGAAVPEHGGGPSCLWRVLA